MRAIAIAVMIGAGACHRATPPTPRDRVLALLPAGASVIAVADGGALAALRDGVDMLKRELPPTLVCAAAAALDSTQTGVALGDRGDTLVILTSIPPRDCPALSQISADVWVATIGAGAIAAPDARSALDDDQLARAHDYLRTAPIAVAAALPTLGVRVIATINTAPLEAWVSEDFASIEAAAAVLDDERTRLGNMGSSVGGNAFAQRLSVTRAGSQLIARLASGSFEHVKIAEAASFVVYELRELLHPIDRAAPPPRFPCPSVRYYARCTPTPAGWAIAITDPDQLAIELRLDSTLTPVVVGGQVTAIDIDVGNRGVSSLGLVSGDRIVALHDHAVSNVAALIAELTRTAPTSLLVARGPTQIRIDVNPP